MLKNTASQVVGFFMLDSSDGETGITTGTPTVYITKDGGTQATGGGTSTHEGNGQWTYAPTQAETNADHILFTMKLSGAITQSLNVYPGTIASLATQSSVDTIDGNVDAILVDTAEIGAAGAGLTALATQASVDVIDSNVDAILVDTNELQTDDIPGTLTTLTSKVDTIDGIVDSILVDTGTTIPATLTTIDNEIAVIDGIVDSILVDTAEIGAAGAGLTALATQASVDTIDGIVDAILVDTDELQVDNIPGLIAALENISVSDIRTELATELARIDDSITSRASQVTLNDKASQASVNVIDSIVDDILEDTGTSLPVQIDALNDLTQQQVRDAMKLAPSAGSPTAGSVDIHLDDILSSGGGGLTQQQVRDSLMLAPTAGSPAAGSIDQHLDTVEADTNELQTDWADGGRLDLILDARSSQSSVDTVDALIQALENISSQGVRDAMKLAPSAGSPAASSVDDKLDDIPTATENATALEAAIINEGDGQQVIDAILQVINTSLDLPSLELQAIAAQVRTELTAELALIDAAISSRSTVTTAEVRTEVDAGLTAYDPPTKTEMDARTLPAASYGTAANQTTILNRIGAFTGSGLNTVLGFFRALMRSDVSNPSDVGGTFDALTDSVESLRDNQGAGGSGLTQQQVRDSMKLAPSAGSPSPGSIDMHLDTIEADTDDLQTSQGDWATATGFATQASVDTIDGIVDEIKEATITNASGADIAADIAAVKTVADTVNSSTSETTQNTRELKDISFIATGAPAVSSTSSIVRLSGVSQADDYFNNDFLVVKDDTDDTIEWRRITDYANLNSAATVDTPFSFTPSTSDSFYVVSAEMVTAGTGPTAAAIRAEMDANSTKLSAIVADTNEIQTDLADGGRLDLIFDALLADTNELQTDWANDGRLDLLLDAATVSNPTAAQIRQEMDDNSTKLADIVADTNELQAADIPALISALNNISAQGVRDAMQLSPTDPLAAESDSTDGLIATGSTYANNAWLEAVKAAVPHVDELTVTSVTNQTTLVCSGGLGDVGAYDDQWAICVDNSEASRKSKVKIVSWNGVDTIVLEKAPSFTIDINDRIIVWAGANELTKEELDAIDFDAVDAQQVRDSLKLAPTAGSPAAGSIDQHLDDIESAGGSGLTQQQVRDAMKLAPSAGTPATGSVDNEMDTLLSRLGAFAGSGSNTVLGFFRSLMRKDVTAPTDVGGNYDSATDSNEAIRDNHSSISSGGGGGGSITVTASNYGQDGETLRLKRGSKEVLTFTGLSPDITMTHVVFGIRDKGRSLAKIVGTITSPTEITFTITAAQALLMYQGNHQYDVFELNGYNQTTGEYTDSRLVVSGDVTVDPLNIRLETS